MTTITTDKAIYTIEEQVEEILAEIMTETGATYEEACIMDELGCTLEEAQDNIAKDEEYARLLIELMPGNIEYYKNQLANEGLTPEQLQRTAEYLAKELTEEQAWTFVFEWEMY